MTHEHHARHALLIAAPIGGLTIGILEGSI